MYTVVFGIVTRANGDSRFQKTTANYGKGNSKGIFKGTFVHPNRVVEFERRKVIKVIKQYFAIVDPFLIYTRFILVGAGICLLVLLNKTLNVVFKSILLITA